MIDRRRLLALLALSPLAARPALAASPEIFSSDGLAIRGTDPVAYFAGNGPVAGDAANGLMWRGAEWRFASAENRAQFEADPARFAPQYGGYCAFAVSRGAVADTDPDAWTLHDGKLYLNFSVAVRSRWARDIPGNVTKADANWPGVLA